MIGRPQEVQAFQVSGRLGEQRFNFRMGDVDMGKVASSVSIIGGADGPTSIFIAGKVAR